MLFELYDDEPEQAIAKLGASFVRKISVRWNDAPLAVWGMGAAIAHYVRPRSMPDVSFVTCGDPTSAAVQRLVESVRADSHRVIECNPLSETNTFLLVKNNT
jgi:hypothetical protein